MGLERGFVAELKMVPDVAFWGIRAVKSTLFPYSSKRALPLCHSVYACDQILKISRSCSSVAGFTSCVPGDVPFPPGHWWGSTHCWDICQLLCCYTVFAASLCRWVFTCPVFQDRALSVSLLLVRLHSFQCVLTLFHYLFKYLFFNGE